MVMNPDLLGFEVSFICPGSMLGEGVAGYPSRTPAWMGARLQGRPHIVHAESPPALASLDRSGRESPCADYFPIR